MGNGGAGGQQGQAGQQDTEDAFDTVHGKPRDGVAAAGLPPWFP